MESRTPKFCSVCGTPLEQSNRKTGFDPFTGEPELEMTLRCPNPTTNHKTGLLSNKVDTEYQFHPSWTNIAGVWSHN